MTPGAWRGEIVGHRGAAGVAPENTLASFEAAIAAGADSVELDVRTTLDGHAVVFHDADATRLVPGAPATPIARLPLVAVLGLDVGASSGRPGCRVPSLDATLRALAGRVRLHVEIKGEGVLGLLALGAALDALRRHGQEACAVVSSFHASVLDRARRDAPHVPRAYITSARTFASSVDTAIALGCEGLHVKHVLASARLVARCRQAGMKVRAWTANEAEDVTRLMGLGVDGIVSDLPGRVRELCDTIAAP